MDPFAGRRGAAPYVEVLMRVSLVIAIFCLSSSACGDDDSKPADTTGGDTASPDTTADTSAPEVEVQEETSAPDAAEDTSADTSPDTTADTTPPAKVDEACSEQGYTDCFHNGDCAEAERCEDMSASELEIPCCVTGPRGTADAGVACTSENDCASGLCISYNFGPLLCSKVCESDAECPPAAAKCSVIGACVAEN